MAHTVAVALVLGSSQTGLTLEAVIVDLTGTPVGAAITAGFQEIGAGNYLHALPVPDGMRGGVVYQGLGGGAVQALLPLNPEDTNADTPTSSRAAAGAAITVVSPVAANGDITVVAGDDYGPSPANLPRILLTIGAGLAPDLTNGTVTWRVPGLPGTPLPGAVVTASGAGAQQVALDVTGATTAAWPPGDYRYAARCVAAGGAKETVMRGRFFVQTAP